MILEDTRAAEQIKNRQLLEIILTNGEGGVIENQKSIIHTAWRI